MIWKHRKIETLDLQSTFRSISRHIKESGFTDKELADCMTVSVQAVNKWRNGKSIPDIENMFLLSQMLGVSLDKLLVARKKNDGYIVSKATGQLIEEYAGLWPFFYHGESGPIWQKLDTRFGD